MAEAVMQLSPTGTNTDWEVMMCQVLCKELNMYYLMASSQQLNTIGSISNPIL